MEANNLRVAMFSGNYNYTRDGANQSLNRLVDFLLRQGVSVRVYSPTTKTPAFSPKGDLVSLPSTAMPFGREEYRIAWRLPGSIRQDIGAFRPNMFHIAIPALMGSSALRLARRMRVPAVASMHTRFETYPRFYGMSWLEPIFTALLARFYKQCDAVVAPSPSAADVMRQQGMADDIGIWTRGIDTSIFNPSQRSFEWRRALGFGDRDVVIGYLGRLVMEKGLDVFASAIAALRARSVPYRVLVIGDGPARRWMEEKLPEAHFAGLLTQQQLGIAAASMDVMLNPSTTETFGNVMLEAMASAVPVVAARAAGSQTLVQDGVTGRLVAPGYVEGFADALQGYCEDTALRTAHGQAGHAASTAYDWEKVNQAMLDIYLKVAHEKGL